MKNPWTIIGIITVVLFGGAFWYASVSAEKNNEGVEISAYTKGNSEATITLVEYSDFQCPACRDFQPAIDDALELYGDSIKFEYRHFPIPNHTFAPQAAVAAEAAGQQDKFFEYHDLLFEEQLTWSRSATPQSLFIQYAERLDLDIDMFKRHTNASVLRDHVQSQFAEGRSSGVTGTPTFFLNGERMEFQTYQEFLDQIGDTVNGDTSATGTTTTQNSDVKFGI